MAKIREAKELASFPETVSPVKGSHGANVFQIVQVGEKARVYGKIGYPVSPELTIGEASKLAGQLNAKDPEQLEAKSRPQGAGRKNPLADEAAAQLQ